MYRMRGEPIGLFHNLVIPAKCLPVLDTGPESRPRLNMGASLQIPAFHPHPNPLPSTEGVTQGLLRGKIEMGALD